MKVAILFDGASAYATNPDLLILGTVEAIERSLLAEGNDVTCIPVYQDGKWIEKLRRGKFDLAFNMCEGIDGIASLESAVISVLELFKIPFTGASSYTTAVCLRKPVINAILEKAGLPIPRFATIRRGDPLVSVGFPAIVKPAAEDASLGVEQRSVVRNTRQLAERVEAMLELWSEVIVQRYVDGREVNVGILGDTVLPIAEIDFRKMPRGPLAHRHVPIEVGNGQRRRPGGDPALPREAAGEGCQRNSSRRRRAWKLVGGFGYGRVDMRIDANGQPWILEVNANPDIAPDAGLATMARVAGIEYPALIRNICELGLDRARAKIPQENWALAQPAVGPRAGTERARSVRRRRLRFFGYSGDRADLKMQVKLGALQRGHRNRIREILDATSVFRDEEVAVALELFDETFAVGSGARAVRSGRRRGELRVRRLVLARRSTSSATSAMARRRAPIARTICIGSRCTLIFRASGGGSQLLDEVERRLRQREARLLVVETSSRDDYAPDAPFYETRGYDRRSGNRRLLRPRRRSGDLHEASRLGRTTKRAATFTTERGVVTQ